MSISFEINRELLKIIDRNIVFEIFLFRFYYVSALCFLYVLLRLVIFFYFTLIFKHSDKTLSRKDVRKQNSRRTLYSTILL